jgi:DNA polymerase-1
MKEMFVFDLMNMAFRGYYAHPDLKTTKGVPTGMLFGVVKILNTILDEFRPDYCVVATDSSGKTFRHDLYPGYKSNRSAKPDDFIEQIGPLYRIVEAYGFPLSQCAGMEADDMIGSIVRKFASDDLRVTIVSGDKDFMQLVGPSVRLLRVMNDGNFFYEEKEVREKFGCGPSQVIDCLAIMGDSADTVPGVKGIGKVGAGKLIARFGSLEEVYRELDQPEPLIPPKMAEKLIRDREMAFLSKSLVTIKTDVPLSLSLDGCANQTDVQLLYKIYEELEFKSLIPSAIDTSIADLYNEGAIE